jgi:hypothetical protein
MSYVAYSFLRLATHVRDNIEQVLVGLQLDVYLLDLQFPDFKIFFALRERSQLVCGLVDFALARTHNLKLFLAFIM